MNLVIDLQTESFVSSSAYSTTYLTPVRSVDARRREIFPLTVQFARNGALTDINFTATLTAAVKLASNYASTTPLAEALTFTKTGTGATAVYSAALSLFTTPLEDLFAPVDGVEPTSVEAVLEVQWADSSETHISQALPLTISNCVYRDDDATPETSSPAPVPVTIGTVTTGAAGSDASVTNVGTSSAAVLNFTIPRGANGSNGTNGSPGATGPAGPANSLSIGTVTSGSEASATITGTAPSQTLNLVLPTGGGGGGGTAGWPDFVTHAAGTALSAELGGAYFLPSPSSSQTVNLPKATGSGKSIIFSDPSSHWATHPPAFEPAAFPVPDGSGDIMWDQFMAPPERDSPLYLKFAVDGAWLVLVDQPSGPTGLSGATGTWVVLGGLPSGATLESL